MWYKNVGTNCSRFVTIHEFDIRITDKRTDERTDRWTERPWQYLALHYNFTSSSTVKTNGLNFEPNCLKTDLNSHMIVKLRIFTNIKARSHEYSFSDLRGAICSHRPQTLSTRS